MSESKLDLNTLLDASAAAKEVATLVALVLIQTEGDPDAALEMLGGFEGIAEPETINELDSVRIGAEAVRTAMWMRGEAPP